MSLSDQFKVTLKRHTGERASGVPGETIVVDCGQDWIFVNGQPMGYAPDEGQISITRNGVEPSVLAFIKTEVERLKKKPSTGIVEIAKLEDSNVELVSDSEAADEPLT